MENNTQNINNFKDLLLWKLPWDIFIISYLVNCYQKKDLEELRDELVIKHNFKKLNPSENYKLKTMWFLLARHHLDIGKNKQKDRAGKALLLYKN